MPCVTQAGLDPSNYFVCSRWVAEVSDALALLCFFKALTRERNVATRGEAALA